MGARRGTYRRVVELVLAGPPWRGYASVEGTAVLSCGHRRDVVLTLVEADLTPAAFAREPPRGLWCKECPS